MPKSLNQVSTFGAIDAESDDLLLDCFERPNALVDVLEGRRFLILGRKGSGKTAIYRYILNEKRHDRFALGFTFADYPWQFHDKQIMPAAAQQERYLNSWQYLLLVAIARVLVSEDQSQPWSASVSSDVDRLRKFVVDTYGTTKVSHLEVFNPKRIIRGLDGLQLGIAGLSAGAGISVANLPQVFPEVIRAVSELVLRVANPKFKYFILFDELDIGFATDSEEYQQRLIGLLLAARWLVNLAADAGKQIRPIVFLRSDIFYEGLHFNDKNKVRDSHAVEMEWGDRGESKPLRNLMAKRFAEQMQIDPEFAWEAVFDEEQEMRGRQSKYKHITERTFERPRDMIKFCNCVLAEFLTSNLSGAERFANEHVNGARKSYSVYLRDELSDELLRHVPNQSMVFEILSSLEYQSFTRDEIEVVWKTWQDRMPPELSLDGLLDQLFRFSVIGFYRAGGSGYGGSEYVYRYLDRRAEFNRKAERFSVHNGLVEALQLKRWERKGW